jgi:hypothetical protein
MTTTAVASPGTQEQIAEASQILSNRCSRVKWGWLEPAPLDASSVFRKRWSRTAGYLALGSGLSCEDRCPSPGQVPADSHEPLSTPPIRHNSGHLTESVEPRVPPAQSLQQRDLPPGLLPYQCWSPARWLLSQSRSRLPVLCSVLHSEPPRQPLPRTTHQWQLTPSLVASSIVLLLATT